MIFLIALQAVRCSLFTLLRLDNPNCKVSGVIGAGEFCFLTHFVCPCASVTLFTEFLRCRTVGKFEIRTSKSVLILTVLTGTGRKLIQKMAMNIKGMNEPKLSLIYVPILLAHTAKPRAVNRRPGHKRCLDLYGCRQVR